MLSDHAVATVGEILVEFVSHTKGCGLEVIGPYSGPYPSGAPAIFLDQAARMGARTAICSAAWATTASAARRHGRACAADGVGADGMSGAARSRAPARPSSRITRTARATSSSTSRAPRRTPSSSRRSGAMPDGPRGAARLGGLAGRAAAALRASILDTSVRGVLEAGGKIVCDPNARPELMRDPEAGWAALNARSWPGAACLMPSTSDLGFLFPDLGEEAAIDRLLRSGAGIVAIKRGANGATVVADGERHDLPGHAVAEIDPTGAGDCFCGTFVALLAQGVPAADAGRQANAAGAIAVTRRGPMEGNSGPEEVARFLGDTGTEQGGVTA